VLKPTGILTLVACVLMSMSAFAASQTLTGTVTDTMCGQKHMTAGKSDADCTRECMKSKGSWSYGLVVGNRVYSLSGDQKQFDSFAGKRVQVTGELTADRIAVQQITTAR
jgi:hypothetical protein